MREEFISPACTQQQQLIGALLCLTSAKNNAVRLSNKDAEIQIYCR
jgi:hypothetical protein